MEDLARIVVQWLHVLSGVMWIGGGFYAVFVQLPALAAMPPAARGPAIGALAPRQITYLIRAADITLTTGVLNLVLGSRVRQLSEPFGSRWAIVIGLGIVLTIVLYVILRVVVKPLITRFLNVAQAAGSDPVAAAQMPALRDRIQRLGYIQLAIGVTILLAMVTARFS